LTPVKVFAGLTDFLCGESNDLNGSKNMPVATCQTCARVMRDKNDFPRGNFSSEFCVNCVDEKGMIKPKDIIREDMIHHRIKHSGLDEDEARELVENLLERLPAWRAKR
jgi:hypothetical protein